jgi:hypothetical protein
MSDAIDELFLDAELTKGEYDIIKNIIRKLKAQRYMAEKRLAEFNKLVPCAWTRTNGKKIWKSDCGISWAGGSPQGSGINFCPKCGRRVAEILYTDYEFYTGNSSECTPQESGEEE